MELGLTFPLQRFLKRRPPPYGAEPDRRSCWDLHVITMQGNQCLLAVHCHSRYAFVRYDVTPLQWADLPALFREGLLDSLAAGSSQEMAANYLDRAGGIDVTRTMAAGRWPFSTGPGRMCWHRTCAWTRTGRSSPCWTMLLTPVPAGVRALTAWGPGWSG